MSTDFERQERALLCRMLRNVGEQEARRLPKELTAFASMKGERFAGELVVVGRAPNGWRVKWTPEDLLEAAALDRIVEETLQSSRGRGDRNECPMLWVSDLWGNRGERADGEKYNTKKSAFWRVIRSVAGKLGVDIDKPSWPTYLAWSNLYRVAPCSGGNPSAFLCRAQVTECIELFAAELAEWKPKRVLMLTGLGWAQEFLKGKPAVARAKYVEGVFELGLAGGTHRARIVVSKHPERKPETPLVEEVMAAFQ